jgi:asparagine synthase (glutamine-hydrolysing)
MCGINAIAGPLASAGVIAAMNRALAHRGPDGEGTFASPRGDVHLGHVRLAILDLSDAARQPLGNEDGAVQIVFNGEIYNYRALARDLALRGHRFRSASDTEVLVHLYEEKGERLLDDLNGMFAFALYDARAGRLFAARDETGVKPLYYAELAGGGLAISSELKAILAAPGIPRDLDREAIADFLAYQFIPDPRTPFRAVRRLGPGEALVWERGRVAVRRAWTGFPPARGASAPLGPHAAARALRRTLLGAVERQLVSDRPVGACLSGGLDSSAIVAAAVRARGGAPIRCYTVGYTAADNALDPFEEDLPHARRVALRLGVPLEEIEVEAHAARRWPEIVRILDEPIADPAALNAFLIARRARADGTVVLLSGQGADEIFGGYRRHAAGLALGALGRLPAAARRGLARAAGIVPGARPGRLGTALRRLRKMLEAAEGGEDESFLRLAMALPLEDARRAWGPALRNGGGPLDPLASGRALLAEVRGAAPLDRMLYRDLKTYLPAQNLHYTDRTAMASGVEVRVPFLDDEVLALAISLAPRLKIRGPGRGKAVLREAVAPWLPREVLRRPKTGFGVPLRAWLRGDLAEAAADLLGPAVLARRGLLDAAEVERQRRAFARGAADYAYPIFTYLTLELWCRAFLDHPAPHVVQ